MSGYDLLTVARTRRQHLPAVPGLDATPFIKWAGGKTQLLPQLGPAVPKAFKTYYEPFAGSAAMFFWLRRERGTFPAVLMDLNPELVNCYQVVRDNVKALIPLLARHQRQHGKRHYYQVRDLEPQSLRREDRAARFIYLNKTCYNGLYRVNSQGKFNVPMGSYKNPAILETEVLLAASQALQTVDVREGDFSDILEEISSDDFVYLDPPYYPISETSSFTGYAVSARGRPEFGAGEHQRLAQFFKALDGRGCKMLLSNSHCHFVMKLYQGFRTQRVQARRNINSDGSKRGAITELVIRNY
ncbi:MAG: DNA adenine methylase [Dehalococcoidia bacterium]